MGNQHPTYTNAQISNAHRFAPGSTKPPGNQYLIGQWPTTHVTQSDQKIKGVKLPGRLHDSQPHHRQTNHQNARQHQSPGAKAVDEPACGKTKQGTDDHFTRQVARGDHGPGPAKFLYPKIKEKRQPVEHDAYDGEQT